MWFWFKLQLLYNFSSRLGMSFTLIPSIRFNISPKDDVDCREYTLSLHFLNMGIYMSFSLPFIYIFNEDKEYIGPRVFPSIQISKFI